MSMKQLLCSETGIVELVDVAKPTIEKDEILVKLDVCGVCGTDLSKIYNPSQPKPVSLGHEIVGIIAEKGKEVTDFEIGQRVVATHHIPDYSSHVTRRRSETMDTLFKSTNFVPGGFAEYIKLSSLHVQHTTLPIPDDMSNERAVFAEPLTCVLRSLARTRIVHGDKIAVVGVGASGLLFLPLLHDLHEVLACDVKDEKLMLAKQWFAHDTLKIDTSNTKDIPPRVVNSQDMVILTVLNEGTFSLATHLVRDGGTILLFGAKPNTSLQFDMYQIWRREINIISSYGSTPDLLPQALAILKNDIYKFETTISHRVPLISSEVTSIFRLLKEGQASKIVVTSD